MVASPPAAVDAVPRSCSALVCAQDGRTPVLRAALAGNDTIVIQLATKMADVNLYLDLAALVDAMKDAAKGEEEGEPRCSAATAAAVVTLADSWKAKVRTAVDAFAKPKESGARKRWGKVVNRTKEAPQQASPPYFAAAHATRCTAAFCFAAMRAWRRLTPPPARPPPCPLLLFANAHTNHQHQHQRCSSAGCRPPPFVTLCACSKLLQSS